MNAFTKQYKKIFTYEDVELEFTDGSIEEIAIRSMERESGARGLRAVLEKLMLDLMFEIPSMNNIAKITVTREMVAGKKGPDIVYREEEKSA
jgi:ATP-dependent Clp protease ATP-binding subunit ClpX